MFVLLVFFYSVAPVGDHHDLDLNLGIAPPQRAEAQSENMEMEGFQNYCGSTILPEFGAKVL